MDHNSSRERLEVDDIEIEGGDTRRSTNNLFERNDSGSSDSFIIKEPLLSKNKINTTSQIAIVGANICPIESLDYEYDEPTYTFYIDCFLIWFCFCNVFSDDFDFCLVLM